MADIDSVADDVYAVAPAEFTARRAGHLDAARAAGDQDLVAAIKTLRRPTMAGWLVNRLARDARDELDEVLGLAAQLRRAQREGAGDELRRLSRERHDAVLHLTARARALAAAAGQPASGTVLSEVRSTLEAAVADPATAEAVRSGRLTAGSSYAGFGELGSLAAVPPLEPAKTSKPSRRQGAESPSRASRQRAAAARERLRVAEDATHAAETEAAEASDAVRAAIADLAGHERELRALDRQRRTAQTRIDQAERTLAAAKQSQLRAASRLERASSRLEHAREVSAELNAQLPTVTE